MKTTILKWTLLIALIAYAVGMAVWANARADADVCTGIQVNISGDSKANEVTLKGVLSELDKYPKRIKGAPMGTINTLDIERWLMRLSNFEDVSCVLNSQGVLNVDILPMIPEIRVFDGARSYYVNKDGKEIASSAEFFSDVPVVSGHFSRSLRPTYVLPVTRYIARDSLLRQLVAQVVVRDPNNIILVPRISGHVINIGDTSRLAEKHKAILTAYRRILPVKGWEMYDTISVKFKRQIVATRRNKAPLYPVLPLEELADPEEAALTADDHPAPERRQRDN